MRNKTWFLVAGCSLKGKNQKPVTSNEERTTSKQYPKGLTTSSAFSYSYLKLGKRPRAEHVVVNPLRSPRHPSIKAFARISWIPLFSSLIISFSAFPQTDLPALISKAKPSIVVVLTYNQEGKQIGQGTGFFVARNGDVISNRHVLQSASRSEIKLLSGEEYSVKRVVAEDSEGDLIRVSVDIPEEKVVPLSISPNPPLVGEKVVVIGTPLGLDQTVSEGIVSAIREIPGFGKIVQMTAPISPGSSGSPVLNMEGEVIGVATFLILAGQNLNFAIPGERIRRMPVGTGQNLAEREESRKRSEAEEVREIYATGLRYVWAGKYEMALPYFVETVKRNPEHGRAFFQMGYCLAHMGYNQEALSPYLKARQLRPQDPAVYNNLCEVLGKLDRYGEAGEACKQALQLSPGLAEAHNNLAWVFHRQGRYLEAVESGKQAIRLQPDFAEAHYNLGNGYAALKKYDQAAEAYKQAIRLEFDYAEAHLNLGAAYNQMGRYEEAIESYKRALRIKPLMAEGYLNLGMTYLKLGDKGSAIEQYKVLKVLNPEMANRLFNLIYE